MEGTKQNIDRMKSLQDVVYITWKKTFLATWLGTA
jgi:hypothetical protein